ncbi:transposase [Rhodococcus opacus]|nr:transposase [Rhodococcus opacus]
MRSSRQIERACSEVVSYRVICAGDTPDHVTISRFRKDNHTACEALFTQVLILAARLGLGRLETIALDGVKIASNASKDANRTEDGLRRAAEAEAARIATAAAAAHATTDDAEDDLFGEDDPGPGQVPAELADPSTRSARIAEALAQLDAEKEAERCERDQKAQDYLARLDAGETVMGRVPVGAEVAAAERRLTEAVAAQQAVIDRFQGGTVSGGAGAPGSHRNRSTSTTWSGVGAPNSTPRSANRASAPPPPGSVAAIPPIPIRGCSRCAAAAGCRATTVRPSPARTG